MGVKYWLDKSKDLKQTFLDVREKYQADFQYFANVRVNFLFRDPPDSESDGLGGLTITAGTARKIGNKERDIYGYDFEICMAAEVWKQYTKRQRFRVMWHEMNHCQIDFEEDEVTPAKDKDGRVKTWLQGHDVLIRTFYEEIEKFGLEPGELQQIEKMTDAQKVFEARRRAKIAAKKLRKQKKSDEKAGKKKKKKKSDEEGASRGRSIRRRKTGD